MIISKMSLHPRLVSLRERSAKPLCCTVYMLREVEMWILVVIGVVFVLEVAGFLWLMLRK